MLRYNEEKKEKDFIAYEKTSKGGGNFLKKLKKGAKKAVSEVKARDSAMKDWAAKREEAQIKALNRKTKLEKAKTKYEYAKKRRKNASGDYSSGFLRL